MYHIHVMYFIKESKHNLMLAGISWQNNKVSHFNLMFIVYCWRDKTTTICQIQNFSAKKYFYSREVKRHLNTTWVALII